MTRAQFGSLDQHSGEHRPSKFFSALGSADTTIVELANLRLENTVLRERVRELETLLAVARAERDTARATGTVGIR